GRGRAGAGRVRGGPGRRRSSAFLQRGGGGAGGGQQAGRREPPELGVQVDRAGHPGVREFTGLHEDLRQRGLVERRGGGRRDGEQDGLLRAGRGGVEPEGGAGALVDGGDHLVELVQGRGRDLRARRGEVQRPGRV